MAENKNECCGSEETTKEEGKLQKAKDFWNNHKKEICTLLPVFIGAGIELVKIAAKRSVMREEQHLKDDYIYDRSMGHYYELRRKPNSSEWIQIDQRKQEGETLGCILQDMGMLK